jgi:hypothetical protein
MQLIKTTPRRAVNSPRRVDGVQALNALLAVDAASAIGRGVQRLNN